MRTPPGVLPTPSELSQAPSRRFQTEVSIRQEPVFHREGRCDLNIYIKHINDSHVERMKEIVTELPALVASITKETRDHLWSVTRQALGISVERVSALQTEAWEHERWHTSVLKELPCVNVEEAQQRCDRSPWDADELLILSHGGRQYVPAFQFLADGSPSPPWATLMTILLKVERFDNWDLFAWLVRPDSMLNNQPPLLAIETNTKQVLSLARQIDREATL